MRTDRIISELKDGMKQKQSNLTQLDRAIEALSGATYGGPVRPKRHFSLATKKRMARAQKQRWAEVKAKHRAKLVKFKKAA